jgi:hypothetical protein
MLARKTTLTHRSGFTIDTPLLVPSFSSKGFLFKKSNGRQISEVTDFMDVTSEVLTESMLVSAYDLFHKHIPPINKIKNISKVVFIDSGGYEVADAHDFSAVFRHPTPVDANWSKEKLKTVLDKWPPQYPAVIISFDNRGLPVPRQMDAARKLFAGYPNQMHDFIIKPDKKGSGGKYINISSILPHVSEIGQFDIVGFTEKELGDSVLSRMLNIAMLRQALDRVGINVPIHVFGSLDPLSSCLYFLAGAEIFDGLTWLRYSYSAGQAVYYHNHGVLAFGIHERDSLVTARALRENVYYLQRMKYQMLDFLPKGDFKKFEFHKDLLKRSYETFLTHLGGAK